LNLPPSDIFYQPCSNLDIIRRVLRNLIISFEKTGDTDKMEEIRLLLNVVAEEND
jgi:hypothetical protein